VRRSGARRGPTHSGPVLFPREERTPKANRPR
jgi:hypothetical protein